MSGVAKSDPARRYQYHAKSHFCRGKGAQSACKTAAGNAYVTVPVLAEPRVDFGWFSDNSR